MAAASPSIPAPASRASSPARAAPRSAVSSSAPSAVGKAGRIGSRCCGMKAQRRAMTRVLSQASGRSAKSARISAAGRK